MVGNQLVRRAAAAGVLNGFDGAADGVNAVADGVRKVAVEEQKLQNAAGREVGGVDLAIRFEGSAATQQAHQLKILVAGASCSCA